MNAMKDFDRKSSKAERSPSQYITEDDASNFDLEKDLDEDRDTDLDEDLDEDLDLDIDLDEDPEWDPELDMDIDPDQSEASRYNEEEFLDSDEQVNEYDSLKEHADFREGDSDSEYPAHANESDAARKERDKKNRIVN
ncbi:MAG TPA: hypothetical protein DDW74_02560 [Porphyromonadaceae bacterium]|nr:hypothetical protein [Porphyromonadaceae bacterium]